MSVMYEFSVPVFVKGLRGLRGVLQKCQDQGVDEAALLQDCLAPDMFPFVRQVQIACDNAKGAVVRLAGQPVPSIPDTETNLTELIARIDRTIDLVEHYTPELLVGSEDRSITLPYFPGHDMRGYEYLRDFALPNFFFHCTTAYALARKAGVQIGKTDYLHSVPLRPL